MSNILDHKKGSQIGIVFAQKPAPEGEALAEISQEKINAFFDEIKAAADKAGFVLDMWGLKADFEKALYKDYGKRKWFEAIQERDQHWYSIMSETTLKDLVAMENHASTDLTYKLTDVSKLPSKPEFQP